MESCFNQVADCEFFQSCISKEHLRIPAFDHGTCFGEAFCYIFAEQ